MQVENWVKNRLLADEAVKAIVGNRVFPVWRPQENELPAIVYFRTGTQRDHHMQGPNRQAKARIRLHACARAGEYTQAKELLEAIRPLFNAIREKPPAAVSQFFVARCVITDEADAWDSVAEGQESPQLKPYMDMEIDHQE